MAWVGPPDDRYSALRVLVPDFVQLQFTSNNTNANITSRFADLLAAILSKFVHRIIHVGDSMLR